MLFELVKYEMKYVCSRVLRHGCYDGCDLLSVDMARGRYFNSNSNVRTPGAAPRLSLVPSVNGLRRRTPPAWASTPVEVADIGAGHPT